MKQKAYSRKDFITAGALALSGLALHASAMPGRHYPTKPALRIGIIGTGARGMGIAKMLQSMPAVKLVAFCDVIPDHLKKALALTANQAKAYTDFQKLLDDQQIDAVVIATPLYLHAPMALAALSAGKHVYLEKAMAYDIPQTLELARQAIQSKQVFQVGFQYRYFALYHKVKEVIEQGWLGKITQFECQYNRNSNWRFPVPQPQLEQAINWRMYRAYCGGPLSELCAHQIDAIHFLMGFHPLKVMAAGGINYWKDGRETYDHIRAVYAYPEGIQANVTSVLSNAYNGYNIRILGDKATLEIQRDKAFIYAESLHNEQGTVDGVTGATLLARTQGKAEELVFKKPGEKLPDPTRLSLDDFIACILDGKKPVSNAKTALETTIAIHMGNLAAETEKVQHWEPSYSL